MIKTKSETFLLRISSAKAYSRKKEEFDLMRRLSEKGVRCNKPVDIFQEKGDGKIYSLFSFLPGHDAEENISRLPGPTQLEIGIRAGRDLKTINSLEKAAGSWKRRKLAKHEYYVGQYSELGYRFENDGRVLKFIEENCDRIESGADRLQHDDFHLGNIVIDNGEYSGILDFNRYDWGDPLHEFVKLEWFSWPVSRQFARGQVEGYFGNQEVGKSICLILSLYIAMSIFSTTVWTLKFHPHTMPFIENRTRSILGDYEYFDRIRPLWTT
jgi:aminoglycoside phosphotransferase (APT) family kinase protein